MTTTVPTTNHVLLDRIEIGENHRFPDLEKAKIDELAKSIEDMGQLQPIQVARRVRGEKLDLIFGKRRYLAMKQLGRETIHAEIVDPLCDTDVAQRRAIENLHREGLTAPEEALAVVQLLNAIKKDSPNLIEAGRYERAAELLGQSPRWVRDRAYLTRLHGDVQELCVQGRLSLGHAREIAKLADTGLQVQIAGWAATDEEGMGGMRLNAICNMVAANLQNLKRARWKLDVPFAGKPACDTCPSNSANDLHLFEAEDAPAEPVCVNKKCFDVKARAIDKAIATGVEKVRQDAEKLANGDGGVTISAGDIRKRAPKAVKDATFQRAAKKAIEPGKKDAAPTSSTPANASRPSDLERNARTAYYAAEGQFAEDLMQSINDAIDRSPRHALAVAISETCVYLLSLGPQRRGDDKELKRKARLTGLLRGLVATIIEPEVKDIDAIADPLFSMLKERDESVNMVIEDLDAPELINMVKLLGSDAPDPLPVQKVFIERYIEEHKPKAQPAKKTRKASA
jgi:ParB family chromosome partitioning protein